MVSPSWDKMIENPNFLGKEHLEFLNSFIREYPNFYLAHQLLLKAYHNTGDPRFQRQLEITSLLSPNREELYFFINGKGEPMLKGDKEDENEKEETPILSITPSNQEEEEAEEKELPEKLPIKIENETANLTVETAVFRIEDIPRKLPNLNEQDEEKRNASDEVSEISEKNDTPVVKVTDFYSWLESKTQKNQKQAKITPAQSHQKDTESLLDTFIKNNPSISPLDKNDIQPKKHYKIEPDIQGFSTETLARIFIKQKNYRKAIEVYEQLSLKIPEKKAYFATQILLLQDLLNEKN